jgi:lysosomal Pro-X carboxypeptidase
LSTNWKLCKPLKTADDVKELKSWLSDVYTNLAMINYPYPSNFLVPVPANPISVSGTF